MPATVIIFNNTTFFCVLWCALLFFVFFLFLFFLKKKKKIKKFFFKNFSTFHVKYILNFCFPFFLIPSFSKYFKSKNIHFSDFSSKPYLQCFFSEQLVQLASYVVYHKTEHFFIYFGNNSEIKLVLTVQESSAI